MFNGRLSTCDNCCPHLWWSVCFAADRVASTANGLSMLSGSYMEQGFMRALLPLKISWIDIS